MVIYGMRRGWMDIFTSKCCSVPKGSIGVRRNDNAEGRRVVPDHHVTQHKIESKHRSSMGFSHLLRMILMC